MAAIGKSELREIAKDLNKLASQWGDIQGLRHDNLSKPEVSNLVRQGNELMVAQSDPVFITTDVIPEETLEKLQLIIETTRSFKTGLSTLRERLVAVKSSLDASAKTIFETQFEAINTETSKFLDSVLQPLSYKLDLLQDLHPVAAQSLRKQRDLNLEGMPSTALRDAASPSQKEEVGCETPFVVQDPNDGSSMESTPSDGEVEALKQLDAPVQLNSADTSVPEGLLLAFAGTADLITVAVAALQENGGTVDLDDYGFEATAIDALYLDLIEQLVGLSIQQRELEEIAATINALDDNGAIQWVEDNFAKHELIPQLAASTLSAIKAALDQTPDLADY